jgi:hypothetical protein
MDVVFPSGPRREGRSIAWRTVISFLGAVLVGIGVVVIVWPQVLAYAVGGLFVAFGALLLLSSLAARGR